MLSQLLSVLPADAWSDAFQCQGWWDFSCNMKAGTASTLGGILWWMIYGASNALQAALDWTNASDDNLTAIQNLANSFFIQIGVGILIVTFIVELSRSGWRMSPRGFLMAIARVIGAVAGFRIGIYLFANPDWSIIKLFDQTITNGIMQGMNMQMGGTNNPVMAVMGMGNLSSDTDLESLLAGSLSGTWFGGSLAGQSVVLQNLLETLLVAAFLLGIMWIFIIVFVAILTFRMIALLVMVGLFPFTMALFGDSGFGSKAVKGWMLTFFALLVSKPLAVIILAIGVTIEKSSTGYGTFSLNMWLGSLVMIIIATASPLFSLRFFHWAGLQAAHQADPLSEKASQGAVAGAAVARSAAKTAIR